MPDPVPAEDGVLIAVHAAAVAPGDCKVRQGLLKQMFPVKLPKVPGRDGAGVVVAAGPKVGYAKPGDRVCFVAQHVEQGGAAELIARRRPEIARLPPAVDGGPARERRGPLMSAQDTDQAGRQFEFVPTAAVTRSRANARFTTCPACRADAERYLFHERGARFVQCRSCDAVYVNPPAREVRDWQPDFAK